MTVRPPCFVSLPCGFRSRNWAGSPLVHRRNPRRPLRSVPPRLCRRAPVRSARGWSRSSSRIRLAGYWKAMHARALDREAQLKAEIERLKALLRLREQQLFGRKTETAAATVPSAPDAPRADTPPRRPRGQQRGQPGPKRRDYSSSPGGRRGSCPSARPVPVLAVWSALRRLPGHRGFRHPGGRGPGPSPSHPPSSLSAHLRLWCSSRRRHRPAAASADPQEHPGGLDLGDGALG